MFLFYNILWLRFPCYFAFWVKFLAIYFTATSPRKLIDRSIPTMFPHKRQKEERKNETSAHVFSCEFCKIFKSTTPLVTSENERDETKLLHMNPNWTIVIFELFFMNYCGSPSTRSNFFPIAGRKLKWGKTKWIISFLYSFQKDKFHVEGRAIALNVLSQLRHWYFTELYSSLTSSLHSLYEIYTKDVDKPMPYVMMASEADIRELSW